MGTQNSLADITVSVASRMIDDLYAYLVQSGFRKWSVSSLHKKHELDIRTLNERVACEGVSFLTTALPTLGKSLDAFLSNLETIDSPAGFASVGDQSYPRFLEPVWSFIIIHVRQTAGVGIDGDALDWVDTAACARFVRMVRSFCYLFYKLEVDFTEEQRAAKLATFLEIESNMAEIDHPFPVTLESQWVCDEAEAVLKEVFDGEENPFPSIDSSPSMVQEP